jgi:hypothetical protein
VVKKSSNSFSPLPTELRWRTAFLIYQSSAIMPFCTKNANMLLGLSEMSEIRGVQEK